MHDPADQHSDHGDDRLLHRWVSSRDEAAFTLLARRHGGMVLATCLRATGGDRARAEDAAQAVFIILSGQAAGIRDGTRLAAWLHRTALRAVAQQQRAEARRRRHEREAHMQAIPAQPAHPTDLGELRPHLDAALAGLRSTQREAVIRHYLEGRPIDAVAGELGITVNALRMRLTGAIERLRSLLDRRGVRVTATALVAGLAHEAAAAEPLWLPAATASGAASDIAQQLLRQTAAMRRMAWTAVVLPVVLGVALLAVWRTAAPVSDTSEPTIPAPASTATVPLDWAELPAGPVWMDHDGSVVLAGPLHDLTRWRPGRGRDRIAIVLPDPAQARLLTCDRAGERIVLGLPGAGAAVWTPAGVQVVVEPDPARPDDRLSGIWGHAPDDGAIVLMDAGGPAIAPALLRLAADGGPIQRTPLTLPNGPWGPVWSRGSILGLGPEHIAWLWPHSAPPLPIGPSGVYSHVAQVGVGDRVTLVMISGRDGRTVVSTITGTVPATGRPGSLGPVLPITDLPGGGCFGFDQDLGRWQMAYVDDAGFEVVYGTPDSPGPAGTWQAPVPAGWAAQRAAAGSDALPRWCSLLASSGRFVLLAVLPVDADHRDRRVGRVVVLQPDNSVMAGPELHWAGDWPDLRVSGAGRTTLVGTDAGWTVLHLPPSMKFPETTP
jgi:RNA polymerase sigma-70 factor (ECF subfamily)